MADFQHFLEFSKPFIDSAKKVFETMVYTELNTGKPIIKDNSKSQGDITATLGLTGVRTKDTQEVNYSAMLVLSWPYDTYIKTSSAMLMEEYTEFNEEIFDVGGEICNMIMGNAKKVLSQQGYNTNMAVPTITEGTNHTIKYPDGTTVVTIPIETKHGPMFMELCYVERAP